MGLNAEHLALAVRRVGACITDLEQELNAADGKLGDGDTGGMLRRVHERLAMVSLQPGLDLGNAFGTMAGKVASATGSSLGTLIAVGLLASSKATKGKMEIAWRDIGSLLQIACDAISERGGAKLGDKTMLDVLSAIAQAVKDKDDPARIGCVAVEAARFTLLDFKDQPCRIGRARMFAERSVGLDDPGMLAFVRLTEAICGDDNAAQMRQLVEDPPITT